MAMSSSEVSALDFQSNWQHKFFTIWGGQALSLVGSALVQFALVWWLTVQTGSATTLATASLVALLPQIVLGPCRVSLTSLRRRLAPCSWS